MAKTRIRLGNLNEKCDVIRREQYVDGATGSVYYGDVLLKEGKPCSIKYIGSPSSGSSEEEKNEQRTGKIKIEFVMRYFPGLAFTDEISYNGGRFGIYSLHVIGKRAFYEVRAELQDDQSSLPT